MTTDTTRTRYGQEPRGGAEAWRKLIHISSVVAALAVWMLSRSLTLTLLGAAVVVALGIEWSRREKGWVRYQFLARTRRLLRSHERDRPAGATYLAIAYFLAALLFPRPVAVAAILYGGVGDAVAGLVGRAWGRNRTAWGKSWQGLAGGFLANLGVGLMVPSIGPGAAVAGAFAASLAEFLPLPFDDNLRTTLVGGAVLWLAVLGPFAAG